MKSCVVTFVAISISMAASAGYDDRFGYFQEQAAMDPAVSSEATNDLVREGIASNDPETVDMVIRGLGRHAAATAHNLPTAYGNLPPRAFAEVPGLKEFLIEHWRERHEKAGRNVFEAIVDTMGFESPDGRTITIPPGSDLRPEEGEEASLESTVSKMRARLEPWLMIPQILSVNWPGDPDVERFLYERQETDQGPNTTLTTLLFLNTGKFTSNEANAFRLDQLRSPESGSGAPTAVVWAAEGLAFSRPADALPALIEAGLEHPSAREAVVMALAGYDRSQLRLYDKEIKGLMADRTGVPPTGPGQEAFNKLERLVSPVPE